MFPRAVSTTWLCTHVDVAPGFLRLQAGTPASKAVKLPLRSQIPKASRCTASAAAALGKDADETMEPSTELHDLRKSADISGPRGMMLVGFSPADGAAVEAWMQQMEPGFAVSYCTERLLDGTVQQAMSGAADATFRKEPHEAVDEPLPRLVLLSGVSGEESVAIAEHWERFTGTQVPVFATVVEKMWQRQLRGAILNIMKSYASSSKSQKGAADAADLREMIRKKLEERKAQAGRRLIGRANEPIIVEQGTSGEGQRRHVETEASTSQQQVSADGSPVDKTAVFRQQLAHKPALRGGRQSRKEVHTTTDKKKAVKKGFG